MIKSITKSATISTLSYLMLSAPIGAEQVANSRSTQTSDAGTAQSSNQLSSEIAQIVDAVPKLRVPAKFPMSEAKNDRDGWVRLSFVIEPDGSTSNVVIEESTGRRSFEREALRVIQQWQYEPATENGKPIQQCKNSVHMSFQMQRDKDGVSKRYYRLHRKVNSALKDNNIEKIEALIDKLERYEIRTLRESFYKYQLMADYARLKGNKAQQLKQLTHAYNFSNSRKFFEHKQGQKSRQQDSIGTNKSDVEAAEKLSVEAQNHYKFLDDALFPVLHEKLMLELDFGLVGDALNSVEKLLLLSSAKPNWPAYQQQKQTLVDFIASDAPIITQGSIGERDFWQHSLIRNEFQLADVSGELHKLDIRCRNKRHVYTINDQSTWKIPQSWQGCNVYVYGDNKTTFKLVELNPSNIAKQRKYANALKTTGQG